MKHVVQALRIIPLGLFLPVLVLTYLDRGWIGAVILGCWFFMGLAIGFSFGVDFRKREKSIQWGP